MRLPDSRCWPRRFSLWPLLAVACRRARRPPTIHSCGRSTGATKMPAASLRFGGGLYVSDYYHDALSRPRGKIAD